ncbi:MAG: hypothetical protein ACEQSR_03705 [Candidatus Methylacidiphilales bacterium]
MSYETIMAEHKANLKLLCNVDMSKISDFVFPILNSLSSLQLNINIDYHVELLGKKIEEFTFDDTAVILNSYKHLSPQFCFATNQSGYSQTIDNFVEAGKEWNDIFEPYKKTKDNKLASLQKIEANVPEHKKTINKLKKA